MWKSTYRQNWLISKIVGFRISHAHLMGADRICLVILVIIGRKWIEFLVTTPVSPAQNLSDATPTGHWDFMSVDGRFRDGCMLEALNLVKPEYGMIMLDNSERVHYRKPSEFPSHWLVTSFQSSVSETTLWMACPTVTDANCLRARQEIAAMMNNLPKGTVGSRYTAHMARAKLDGVPGA